MAKICIDPGHGGRDPGVIVAGVREANVALQFSLALSAELTRRGHAVTLTRDRDVDLAPHSPWPVGKGVDLRRRAALANIAKADAFISIHANAAGRDSANGAWVLHARPSSRGKLLAELVFAELAKIPGIPDADPTAEVYSDESGAVGYTTDAARALQDRPRGVSEADWLTRKGVPRPNWYRTLAVLRRTSMPAILVELGFLTNPEDAAQLQREDTRGAVARAIADGVEQWLKT